jgi:hypothetical protein
LDQEAEPWAVLIKGLETVQPRTIAALHTEMLADSAGIAAGRIPVQFCRDERQLDACLEMAAPLVLAELGPQMSPLMLARLVSGHGATVLAVLPSGTLPVSQILSLALSRTPFELVHDVSELSGAVRKSGRHAVFDCEIGEIARALAWRIDRESLEDIIGMLVLGRRRTTVGEALARLDRTAVLRTALRERSLPTPARLLGWGSAFHLVWQVERYGRDISYVARSLGFESSRHCSDAFKFHTGSAPMNVLRGAGFDGILEEFIRRLGSAAEPGFSNSLKATEYLRISA